jgi:uncharacterized protein (DUF58 family)
MMHSFFNFSQLSISAQPKQTGFAQQKIIFPLIVHSKKTHFDLNFSIENNTNPCSNIKLSQCSAGDTQVNLAYLSAKRGEYALGRVNIFSEYSFGLFKSWTHLDFGLSALVYPKPITLAIEQLQLSSKVNENGTASYQNSANEGIDDFFELKDYILGESKARTAWKQLARGQGHYSKHYQESQSPLLSLKLSNMPTANIETKLSYLSYLVIELTQGQQTFSLQLDFDKEAVTTNSGLEHQQACLTALALHHV